MKRTTKTVGRREESEPRSPIPSDSPDQHDDEQMRNGKLRIVVGGEIRKASAASKLLNKRVGLSDRLASAEIMRDPSTMQASVNFGKHIFKEFSEADAELLAGIVVFIGTFSCAKHPRFNPEFEELGLYTRLILFITWGRRVLCFVLEAWRCPVR
jgi:hypothetical protein